jgi:superfamily I DNA/RNA helicase
MSIVEPDKYKKAIQDRQKHVDAVLNSGSKKKIVVAGPGTGKTYLFKKILEGKGNTLTLTFINALVEDLSLELCGLSNVKTLHGFARSALGGQSGKSVKVFPKLSEVIKEDAKILLKKDINFDRLFHTRDDENEFIQFYKRRKDYYDYYGYADIVFAIVKLFESKKEKIPTYEQIVVDEFQDFNKLEVSLIELLAEKSPILLAGDDDQALYDFKDASPEHIRLRYGNKDSGYAPFTLPYCSRCTRVIVETANDVIATAMKIGSLKGRLEKPYHYFEEKKKDRESDLNPRIICGQLFAKQIPWFIERQLAEIAKEVRGSFSVLIISPTKVQTRDIVAALKDKGLARIEMIEKRGGNEPTLLDGLKILLEDGNSNLGWRIASKHFSKSEEFEALVTKSNAAGAKTVAEIIGLEQRKAIVKVVRILRAVRDEKDVDEKELDNLLAMVSIKPRELAKRILLDEIVSTAQRTGNPSIRKLPIKATTVQSSKGLAAEYVFITHFDDQYFIKNKDKKVISDQDICNFIVALTRARRKVFLISTDSKSEPTFLKWIRKENIEKFVFKTR